jgi:hypothetical protein
MGNLKLPLSFTLLFSFALFLSRAIDFLKEGEWEEIEKRKGRKRDTSAYGVPIPNFQQ